MADSIQTRTLHSNYSTENQSIDGDIAQYFTDKYGTSLENYIYNIVKTEVTNQLKNQTP